MNLFSIGPLEIVLIFIVGVLVVGPQRMVQYSQRISKWVKNARKFIQQYSIVLKDIQMRDLHQILGYLYRNTMPIMILKLLIFSFYPDIARLTSNPKSLSTFFPVVLVSLSRYS